MTVTMPVDKQARFELDLRELAAHYGLEIDEGHGTALWTVYGTDGKPRSGIVVQFKEAKAP